MYNDSAPSSNFENGTYHRGDLRRTLISAALELAAESNEWNFSLREVARRAGVSHNAPYNQFAHKKDLLAAAALSGHELLRQEIASALAKTKDPRRAILRVGSAYVQFGIKNPALYQLMFTASLSGPDWRPKSVIAAGEQTRAMVEEIIRAGAASGLFASTLARKTEAASLFAWSAVHGFTMIAISGLTNTDHISIDRLTIKIMSMVLDSMGAKKVLSAMPELKASTNADSLHATDEQKL
jgi:AcrR family transcriptional regulator